MNIFFQRFPTSRAEEFSKKDLGECIAEDLSMSSSSFRTRNNPERSVEAFRDSDPLTQVFVMLREGLAPLVSMNSHLSQAVKGLAAEQRSARMQRVEHRALEDEVGRIQVLRENLQRELTQAQQRVALLEIEVKKFVNLFRLAVEDKMKLGERFALFLTETCRSLDLLIPGHGRVGLPPWPEPEIRQLRRLCARACTVTELQDILQDLQQPEDHRVPCGTRPPVLVENASVRQPGSVLTPPVTGGGWTRTPVSMPRTPVAVSSLILSTPKELFQVLQASDLRMAEATASGSNTATTPTGGTIGAQMSATSESEAPTGTPGSSAGTALPTRTPGPSTGATLLPLPGFWTLQSSDSNSSLAQSAPTNQTFSSLSGGQIMSSGEGLGRQRSDLRAIAPAPSPAYQ